MNCANFKVVSRDEPTISCESCNRVVHREFKCSGLNVSKLEVMDLKGSRNVR